MHTRVYVGPAGWSYPDWNGVVYPSKKPRGFDALGYISSYFNLVEINSTFYRLPDPSTTAGWVDRVSHNAEFQFTIKAHQRFTHAGEPPTGGEFDAFKNSVWPVFERSKLLSILVQFPWSFKDTAAGRRRIDAIIKGLDPMRPCVEVRHGSWSRRSGLEYFASSGVSLCGIDQPLIGDSLRWTSRYFGSAGAYFRFHGRNVSEWFRKGTNRDLRYNYLYASEELAPLVEDIRKASEKAKSVVVVLNNHFRGQAVANALELKSMLSAEKVAVPEPTLRAFPKLKLIAAQNDGPPGESGWLF